jgi:hypothetical protein
MTTGYLFLGGPIDGQRRVVQDCLPVFTVRAFPPFKVGYEPDDVSKINVEDHHYTRREMSSGHRIYAHTSLLTHEILPRLMRGYRPDPL